MLNPFSKKDVPANTQEEIKRRGTKEGLLWTSKRFPWIHVISLSSACTAFNEFQTLSSAQPKDLYGPNYIRPFPVVTQLDVKKQGELGTTRKATVSILAFTDGQLENLTKCYFIPGMGVRIQWGWSESAIKTGNPPLVTKRELTDAQAIAEMNKVAENYPNYSGLQGLVTNFTYNLNKDGYWECSLEIVAAAEPASGTIINEHACDCARKAENETPDGNSKKVVEKRSVLYTAMRDLYKDFDTAYAAYGAGLLEEASKEGREINIAQFNYNGPGRTEKGGEDSAWYEGSFMGVTINQPDTTEPYISWATLEMAVNRYSFLTAKGEYTLGKLSSKGIRIKGHPNVESTDPRVCLIPGSKHYKTIATKKTNWYNRLVGHSGGSSLGGYIVNGSIFGVALHAAGSSIEETNSSAGQSAIDGDYIILDNIMVNTVLVMNELRQVEENGNGSLYEFLINVLRKINEACGGLWEFDIVATTESPLNPTKHPTLTVIDTKVYEAGQTFLIPALPLGTTQSVLRDLILNMKMTDRMKTQALYANGRTRKTKTESGGGCGSNAFAPFGMRGDENITNLAALPAIDPPKCDCENNKSEQAEEPTFDEIFEDLGGDVTDTSVSAARAALVKSYADSIERKEEKHCIGMPLPFEFGFTLDGVGGFAFGQIVSCDRIPEQIRNAYDFQVTTVEHSVTVNDWSVTVNTVCRYKG